MYIVHVGKHVCASINCVHVCVCVCVCVHAYVCLASFPGSCAGEEEKEPGTVHTVRACSKFPW